MASRPNFNLLNMKSLTEAKCQIEITTVATDHRLIRDRWLNIKRILDVIYKELSPLTDNQQTITIDKDSLPIEQRKLFQPVLKEMSKNDMIGYYSHKNESEVVSTSDPIHKFLKGEDIIIKDRNIFENYRKKISEFCDFIEKDGNKRFSKVYKKESIGMEHSQKNTKNEFVNNIYNNGHLQINSGNKENNAIVNANATTKNKIFWYIVCPLFVVILGGVILKCLSSLY